jgi:hypothetical protein
LSQISFHIANDGALILSAQISINNSGVFQQVIVQTAIDANAEDLKKLHFSWVGRNRLIDRLMTIICEMKWEM